MAIFRKSVPTDRPFKTGLRTRILIPQRPERMYQIPAGDVIRDGVVTQDSYWFVIHRRGIPRPKIGVDPLEARAVPETQVRGFLHERVLYKFFVSKLRFGVNSDFTFQSSLEGGRSELGGMVADFLFPFMKIIINIKGPTHYMFLQSKKDEEQEGILAEMGYTVFYPDLKTIESEFLLEDWARRVFNLATSRGSGSKADTSVNESDNSNQQALIDSIMDELDIVDTNLDYAMDYLT